MIIDDKMLAIHFPGWDKLTQDKRDQMRQFIGLYLEKELGVVATKPEDAKAPRPKAPRPKAPRPKGTKMHQGKDAILKFLARHKDKTHRPCEIADGIKVPYDKIGFVNPIGKQTPQILAAMWDEGLVEKYEDSTYGWKE